MEQRGLQHPQWRYKAGKLSVLKQGTLQPTA